MVLVTGINFNGRWFLKQRDSLKFRVKLVFSTSAVDIRQPCILFAFCRKLCTWAFKAIPESCFELKPSAWMVSHAECSSVCGWLCDGSMISFSCIEFNSKRLVFDASFWALLTSPVQNCIPAISNTLVICFRNTNFQQFLSWCLTYLALEEGIKLITNCNIWFR